MNSGRNLKRSWIAVDNEISSVSHYMMYVYRYNTVSSMLPHILHTFGLDDDDDDAHYRVNALFGRNIAMK